MKQDVTKTAFVCQKLPFSFTLGALRLNKNNKGKVVRVSAMTALTSALAYGVINFTLWPLYSLRENLFTHSI
jgi:hypothetical protein